jgi:uncharacterized RDD family membrane protein YckC
MTCAKCGASIPEGAAFCPACGHPAVSFTPHVPEPAATATSQPFVFIYGGFWLRLAAYLLDTILLSIVLGPLMRLLFLRAGLVDPATGKFLPMDQMMQKPGPVFAAETIIFVGLGLYFSLLESSPWQATLGKKAFGLQVTDLDGRRLTFARATGRYFAKIVSNLTFGVGYLMAGFTKRKQALHDVMAESLVIRNIKMKR